MVGPKAATSLLVDEIAASFWEGLFVRDCRRLRAFDADRAPLGAYLVGLAKAEVKAHHRRRKAREVPFGNWEPLDTKSEALPKSTLQDFLGTLPLAQRTFFECHLLARPDDRHRDEMSPANLWQKRRRGFQKLKQFLEVA
jgi:hypothetical protein